MMQDYARQLLPGERVLWEGTPFDGILLRPIEFALIPFSLVWGGFALFWNLEVWSTFDDAASLPFKLFGLPFLIAGLYVTVGRFWFDRYLRRRLIYLVTDRRILILKRGGETNTKSLDIKRLPSLDFGERPDGSGTIRFGPSASLFAVSQNLGIWQPTFDPTFQFLRISNVRAAYELIQRAAA